jgi:subtilisin family serine protease/PKD repeat protein
MLRKGYQLTSLSFAVGLLLTLASRPALADLVLVEFNAADGATLVASGDHVVGPEWWDGEETRKRVEARARAIERARADLLATLPAALAARASRSYRNFPLLPLEIDELDRLTLEDHPQVVAIHSDRQRQLLTDSSLAFMGSRGWHEAGDIGDGTAVAVLDSGIRYWNGFFGDCPEAGAPGCRVAVFEGFATLAWGAGETDPRRVAESSSHGTNVGGIVGDVAPGTALLSLNVFAVYDPDPSTGFGGGALSNDSDVVDALDWSITHRDEYNIVSANMSLGSEVDPGMTGYCTGWMAGGYVAAFANTRDAGILPVVASGNDYVKTSIAPPACVSSAVAVGAGYDDPAYGFECGTGPVIPGAVICFSDSSALIDLIAPGNDIDAGGIPGLAGTSMASPHVAGLAAVYQARYGSTPLWTLERMRVDALPTIEIGTNQTFIHRYAHFGDARAELTFDSGAVLASDFDGLTIPDGSSIELAVSGDVVCQSELCAPDVAGRIYLDLTVVHEGTGDLIIELEAPDGRVARHEVASDDELGLENVNSILGSQHLPEIFDELRGGPIAGTWTLRLADDEHGRRGTLYRAVLLIDSARTELIGRIDAPEIARPGEPFEVGVTLENRGNLALDRAQVALELVDSSGGQPVDSADIEIDMPSAPGDVIEQRLTLEGPQGNYLLRLSGTLDPDLAPGLVAEPRELNISYRTFASFEVLPETPTPGEEAQLRIISRGLVQAQRWTFGDGTSSTAALPAHVWDGPGEYQVELQVDGPDGTSTTSRTITVVAPFVLPMNVDGGGVDCSCRASGSRPPASEALLLGLLALLGLAVLRTRARARGVISATILALLLAGCWDEQQPVVPDAGSAEQGPWVSVLDPPNPTIGDVTVYLMLSRDEAADCDVTLEYRVGEGDFVDATLAAPGRATGIEATSEGTEVGLTWLSTADIPGDLPEAQLRARIDCGDERSLEVVSASFVVLNFLENNPGAILITEVSSADENVPARTTADYLELLNRTDEEIPLAGWTIEAFSAAGGSATFVLGDVSIAPGERLVVAEAESGIEGAYELEGELPWLVTSNGALAVFATHQRGVDFVRWGGSPVMPPAGLGWSDDPPLSIPQTLTVLARVDEGDDSDRASDFCVARPTPGEAGDQCIPDYAPSEVLITELDSQGTNDQVEILNDSGEAIDLGGWVLLWDCDDLGSGAIPLSSVELEPGGRLVLRDNGTAGNFAGGYLELGQNLNIDGLIPLALALQDPHGRIIDFLAGGGSRVRWVDWEEDAPTPMPGPQTTLSRRPGDPDTDSNADFCLTEVNLLRGADACLEPMDIELVISEVMPGRPDWVEIFNSGSEPVSLDNVYVSYTAPYYGGSVGDYQLRGVLAPGDFVVLSERDLDYVEDEIVLGRRENISLAPEGDGSVALRDLWGYGIDFVMWGEPAGTPLWPSVWLGLGADLHDPDDFISLQRYPADAEDTDTRDDWCWAHPSPDNPNAPCE